MVRLDILFFLFVSGCLCWSLVLFWNRAVDYNIIYSNLEPFDLETELAQYEFQMKQPSIYWVITSIHQILEQESNPNLMLTVFKWNHCATYCSLIQFYVYHSFRIFFRWYSANLVMFLQPMMLPYNGMKTVLVIASDKMISFIDSNIFNI